MMRGFFKGFLSDRRQRRARQVQMFHLETEQKMEIKTYLQTSISFFIFWVILISQFLANYQSHLNVSGWVKQILLLDKIVNTKCIFSILISFIEGTSYLTLHEKVIPLVSLVMMWQQIEAAGWTAQIQQNTAKQMKQCSVMVLGLWHSFWVLFSCCLRLLKYRITIF